MSQLAIVLAALAYAVGTFFFLAHLVTGRYLGIGHSLLAIGAVAHAASVALRLAQFGFGGMAPLPEQLSAIAWLAVVVYLFFSARRPVTVLGALVAPLGCIATMSAYAFEVGVPKVTTSPPSVWLPVHVGPALLGYAVFVLAACLSIVYLLQERQLKSGLRGGLFRRLPPLETLDQLNQRFVSWGFVFFTIGIVAGSVLAERQWGAAWSWEPVQIWSVVTWLMYAGLLQARSAGWRGRRAARLTIASFVVLLASFFTVNLFFPGRHGM